MQQELHELSVKNKTNGENCRLIGSFPRLLVVWYVTPRR